MKSKTIEVQLTQIINMLNDILIYVKNRDVSLHNVQGLIKCHKCGVTHQPGEFHYCIS